MQRPISQIKHTSSIWTVPRPNPDTVSLFSNVNRDSLLFLQAAGIDADSTQHRQLKKTVQALHRRHLDPFKYVEEQTPGCVDQLIAKAQISLPWLTKFEDAWPARIYLKRYVDTKRPHLKCTRSSREKQHLKRKTQISHNAPSQPTTKPGNRDLTVRKFLSALVPSLEHHLDAFIELGIKNQETLTAFLSWPQAIQTQLIDEGREILQLTSLERKGLSVGCSLLLQRSLQESLVKAVVTGDIP